ncbi:MAG: ABC transporter ATP-binding protein [Chloroflexi bacterium]|nr:ABC transporter ATP-binding protein [Chloroflexota bacterium]
MNGSWWSYLRHDEQRDKPAINRVVLRRVAAYAWPYRFVILTMLATIIGSTILDLIPPLLYRQLIDHALPNSDFGHLNLLALGMIGIPILDSLLSVGQRWLSARVGEGVIFDLRRGLFEHLQRMSLRFFTNSRTGEIMARLNNDVVGAQQAITGTIVSLLSNVLTVIGTLAIMLSLEWRLTLASVVILPLFIIPARRAARVLRQITRESMDRNAQMNGLMNETLNVSGALLVKLFGRERAENDRFAERAAGVRDIGIRQAFVGRGFFTALGLVSAVGVTIVFWAGGYLVLVGTFSVGTLVALGSYVRQLYGPLSALTNARVEFANSLVSFERVFEVLDLPLDISDRPGATTIEHTEGRIEFEDVWFDYGESADGAATGLKEVERLSWGGIRPSGRVSHRATRRGTPFAPAQHEGTLVRDRPERWALKGVSFQIEPGQMIALVGPSGAGKTSVTYLVPRLYDPTRGRVTLDGRDLRDLQLTSLSAQIGMVTQETYLFNDTLRSNLLYARADATEAELLSACRVASLDALVGSLPDGLDTLVGERGYRLSGGEKQRVALARVILKNPRILVLDEATAHLDSESEALIQAALERLMEGRTSLVIAHRLSTVLAADRILVLDEGRLVEQGTHAELLAVGGLYARLYETQFRAAQESVAGDREGLAHERRDPSWSR